MKFSYYLLVTVLPALLFASCGDTPDRACKLVNNKTGHESSLRNSEANLSETYYKYLVARRVFDRLVQAKGNFGMLAPAFVMTNSEKIAASFLPDSREIVLEEKAYNICASFGRDSLNMLACLLAHELIHYYEKHGSPSAFAENNPLNEWEKEASLRFKITDRIRNEIEADYLGGMLAFAAGYSPHNLMPAFLKKVYAVYQLDPQIEGYPSLEQRIEQAKIAQTILESLVDAFDAATCLTALGEYEAAKSYYEYVARDYSSREVFNNLGVISCSAALNYFTRDEMRFAIPLELDADSRLMKNLRGADLAPERNIKRNNLLQEAVRYFNQAALLDPDYTVAHLNAGCAYALMGDYRRAENYARDVMELEKARPAAQKKKFSDCYVLLGIIAALKNHNAEAEQYFKSAVSADRNNAAKCNLDALKGLEINRMPFSNLHDKPSEEETIEGLSLPEFANSEISYDKGPIKIDKNINLYLKRLKQSKILIHAIDDDLKVLIHITEGRYNKSTLKGIYLKSDKNAILEKYGTPDKTINLSSGELLVYPDCRLIFELDMKGIIKSWCVFYSIH